MSADSAAVLCRLIVTHLALNELDLDDLLNKLDSSTDDTITPATVSCLRGWMFYLKGDLTQAETQ